MKFGFGPTSCAILHGTHIGIVQSMLDYDYVCGRSPSIKAVFSSQKSGKRYKVHYGNTEIFIPTIHSWDEIDAYPEVDTLINLASFRSCTQVNIDAIHSGKFKHVFTIAEGVPERDTRKVLSLAKKAGIHMFGPSIVGGLISGVFRIGHTGGSFENILKSRLVSSGSVGIVTKSGGMMNELCRVVSKHSDGVHSAFQVGGDRFAMMPFLPVIEYFEEQDDIKLIVLLGEVGNRSEIEIADMISSGKITKPVVSRCIGSSAEAIKTEIQFGHAGAKANSDEEKASYKNAYLKKSGAHVPERFDEFGLLIGEVASSIGIGVNQENATLSQEIHKKISVLQKRNKTSITSSISDERGEELTYNGLPISEFVESGSIGRVLGHLRLKKELPEYATDFIETAIILLADHGPAVSGAHNAIITARAGKDVVSSLISGLSTVGPRFGGAITGAGRRLLEANEQGYSPEVLVSTMKKRGMYIQGIGHKVKSIYDPDKRCILLQQQAKNFPSMKFLQYALSVEEITTQKKPNLILNVDGHLAAMLIDILVDAGYTLEEIRVLVETDLFNSFFVIARSIGFIGHHLDQKRLKEGLWRCPWDSIFYDKE